MQDFQAPGLFFNWEACAGELEAETAKGQFSVKFRRSQVLRGFRLRVEDLGFGAPISSLESCKTPKMVYLALKTPF